MPAGPWVLVVGCHRSGTSAVTGALVEMGLQGVDPADRIESVPSNPEHWESLAAGLYDEDLLIDRGGAWDAPPPAADEPLRPGPSADRADPADVMRRAYPGDGPLVWKDPRACLLLPYWRSLLPAPLTAVFVWRDPLAVARSLHTRDGIPLADGLALWERYNRSAAIGLRGVDTFVLDYGAVVEDPEASLGRVGAWLAGLDRFGATTWDLARGAGTIDRGLRHEPAAADDGAAGLPADHEALAGWLVDRAGPHAPLDADPPSASSPWPEAVLGTRREVARLRRLVADHVAAFHAAEVEHAEIRATLEALVRSREENLDTVRQQFEGEQLKYEGVRTELDRLHASTSWKVTAPLRAAMTRLPRGGTD